MATHDLYVINISAKARGMENVEDGKYGRFTIIRTTKRPGYQVAEAVTGNRIYFEVTDGNTNVSISMIVARTIEAGTRLINIGWSITEQIIQGTED